MNASARGSEAHTQLGDAILQLGEGVRRLCEEQVEGSALDAQLVNAVFRDAHSLKGLAGLFGEPQLVALAHAAEDLLDFLRLGQLTLADEVEDLLLELPLALEDWLETGREGDLAVRLRRALSDVASQSAAPPPPVPLELRRLLTTYEEHRVAQVLAQGDGLYAVRVALPLAAFDVALAQLRKDAAPLGEILATLPVAEQVDSDWVVCDLLLGSSQLEPGLAAALGPQRSVRTLSAARPHAGRDPEAEVHGPPRSVRVDIRRLDALMEALDDLHLSRVSLGRTAARLQAVRAPASLVAEILHEVRRMDRRIEELQQASLAVRMVPLGQLFTRTRRLAERLAKELGKEIEVRLEGEDVEVDKLLGEALADPLVHLVHNAVDHGIELPEARVAAGKPRVGSLKLRASQRGGTVILEVGDDGAGIDPAAVKRAAEARGLVGAESGRLQPSDVVRLLLTPGFSTAQGVGPISGRGVGLDAVRAKVVGFAGFLEVDSSLGRGTTFTVALPATLALVRGLLVRAGGRRYALPISAVWEILPLDHGHGSKHRLATGELIRLMSLATLFALPPPPSEPAGKPGSKPFAAIVGPPERRVGLVLDGLEGQRDLVMKPLGKALGIVAGVAGLAQLGPGEPVLILDVPALTDEALGRPALRSAP